MNLSFLFFVRWSQVKAPRLLVNVEHLDTFTTIKAIVFVNIFFIIFLNLNSILNFSTNAKTYYLLLLKTLELRTSLLLPRMDLVRFSNEPGGNTNAFNLKPLREMQIVFSKEFFIKVLRPRQCLANIYIYICKGLLDLIFLFLFIKKIKPFSERLRSRDGHLSRMTLQALHWPFASMI